MAEQERRRVRGPVLAERLRGPDRPAALLVEGGHQGLLASRRYDHPRAIDQQALAHRPGDVLPLEPLQHIDGPEFLARVSLQADDAAVGVHVVELAFGVGAAGPCSWIGARPRPAVLGLPKRLAVEVEGEDDQVVVHVAGDIQAVADDDRRRPAPSQVADLPDELWPGFRPRGQEALLRGNAVTPRAVPLRPVRLWRGNRAIRVGFGVSAQGRRGITGRFRAARAGQHREGRAAPSSQSGPNADARTEDSQRNLRYTARTSYGCLSRTQFDVLAQGSHLGQSTITASQSQGTCATSFLGNVVRTRRVRNSAHGVWAAKNWNYRKLVGGTIFVPPGNSRCDGRLRPFSPKA